MHICFTDIVKNGQEIIGEETKKIKKTLPQTQSNQSNQTHKDCMSNTAMCQSMCTNQ